MAGGLEMMVSSSQEKKTRSKDGPHERKKKEKERPAVRCMCLGSGPQARVITGWAWRMVRERAVFGRSGP